MRLTLRTLLAYLDDVLDPVDKEELAQKIESSEFAEDLVHRTRDTVRRLRLSAPQVIGTGMGLDPEHGGRIFGQRHAARAGRRLRADLLGVRRPPGRGHGLPSRADDGPGRAGRCRPDRAAADVHDRHRGGRPQTAARRTGPHGAGAPPLPPLQLRKPAVVPPAASLQPRAVEIPEYLRAGAWWRSTGALIGLAPIVLDRHGHRVCCPDCAVGSAAQPTTRTANRREFRALLRIPSRRTQTMLRNHRRRRRASNPLAAPPAATTSSAPLAAPPQPMTPGIPPLRRRRRSRRHRLQRTLRGERRSIPCRRSARRLSASTTGNVRHGAAEFHRRPRMQRRTFHPLSLRHPRRRCRRRPRQPRRSQAIRQQLCRPSRRQLRPLRVLPTQRRPQPPRRRQRRRLTWRLPM